MRRNKGFTLIELMIVIAIIAIIAAIAIPNLIQARKHGNETAAIGALKTLATSQSIFREGDKEGDGTLDYGNLTELSTTQLVDGVVVPVEARGKIGAGRSRGEEEKDGGESGRSDHGRRVATDAPACKSLCATRGGGSVPHETMRP